MEIYPDGLLDEPPLTVFDCASPRPADERRRPRRDRPARLIAAARRPAVFAHPSRESARVDSVDESSACSDKRQR